MFCDLFEYVLLMRLYTIVAFMFRALKYNIVYILNAS